MVRPRTRSLFIVFGALLFFCMLWFVQQHLESRSFTAWERRRRLALNRHQEREGKYGQWCRFPKLDVDDPSVKRFYKQHKPLNCSKEKNWIYVKNGTFHIDPDAIARHGGEIICNYTNFWRISDSELDSETKENFKSGSKLKGDFFKAECQAPNDKATYSNLHAGVAPSKEALERSKRKSPPSNALGLNVYMLGLDSVSRMAFLRNLPKMFKYLTKEMRAIVLEGYNIVGDGTPQALIPMFTGKTELELPLTRKRFPNASYVNVYPFVWNEYRNAGYVTLYGEDAADVGTFTYRLKGFKEQPTDHYMRTFYLRAYFEGQHNDLCRGSEEFQKTHFGYVERFWDAYPLDTRKFAFQFGSLLSHNDYSLLSVADDDLVQHLKFFVENGHWNDTIIIVMADHGHRFGSLRETVQGKLEERLPFFSFAFPPWFKDKYPETMRVFEENARRLTTPFDIHATLREILHFDPIPKLGRIENRELSLFHEIPIDRTCTQAGIEAHWCACLEWIEVRVDDPVVQSVAAAFLQAINNATAYERKSCAELSLVKIEKAQSYTPNSALLKFRQSKDEDGDEPDFSGNSSRMINYQVDVRTTPGNAHYEVSATWDPKRNKVAIDLDSVSHVSRYGDKPHCVIDKDYFLAKWCVCYDKV